MINGGIIDFFVSNYSIGVVHTKMDEHQKALDSFKKTIALNPTYKNAYFNLATVHEMMSQPDKAIEYYEKSIQLKGEDETLNAQAAARLSVLKK